MIVGQEVQYRDIAEAPGYQVGSDGSVWSLRERGGNRGKRREVRVRLSVYRRAYGSKYSVVCLRPEPGGKVVCRYVHRLVLEAFIGPCPAGNHACHNDGDSSNNSLENLRWDTYAANMADKERHGTTRHGEAVPQARLTADEVREIRRLARSGTLKQREIGERYGIGQSHVSHIVLMKCWRRIGEQ